MKHYTALIIEDDPDDTELLKLELNKLDFKIDCTDVDSEAGLRASLDEALPDIVISDYSMPGFTGMDALKIVREQKPDLPFILCSGFIGEEQAVDAVKNGVTDYCLKNNLGRLGLSVERELKNYSDQKKAERQRDKAYEIANIGHWELDMVHDKLFWSNAVKKLHEVGSNYVPELETALEFYKEGEHRQKITRVVENTIETGESFEVDLKIITSNGNEKWVRVVGEADFHNGRCIQIFGSTQDISKRKEHEEKLEELALVASKTTDVIFMTDPQEQITWVNKAFEQFSGYQIDEVIGKSPGNILTGPDNDQKTMRRISKAFKKQEALQVIVLNYSKTGDKYWFDLTLDPIFDSNGQCEGFIGIQKNVTEQIEYQQELRKSVERYDIVSKATSDTIWDWDLAIDTIEYSQNFYEMFGYEQQQVDKTEDLWRNKIHPEDQSEVFENIEKALRSSSERFQMEYRFKVADDTYKYIYDRAFIVEDEEGNPIRIIGAMRDVSDQKEAQRKMKEAFQERERILDRINEAFLATDQNWNVTYWNKQAQDVIGIIREDILGKNLWETFPEAKELKFFQEYKRALKEQVSVQFEEYYPPLEEWLEMNVYPSEEGLSVFFRNITERKDAEKSLQELYQKNRLVLESTDEGIYGIDTEGRCTFINRAASNMLGYRLEECIGKNMHKLIHHKFSNGEFYPESECPIYISKNKHESCRVTDEVFWRADGTCFNVEYTSSPMIQEGEIKGCVVAFSDITKRKQQEKELQESLEEKETLLLEVHHRVKNNLAIISSLITLQSMDVEDENFRNMLENTTSRIHSIAMVHELLYQSENFTEIPFEKYLKELLSKIKKIIGSERNHVDLVIKVEDGGRGLNINQAIPLGLMLNELMTNSLKYAFINRQKGKIVVNIARSGNTIKVLYEDNGDGYPDHIDFADTDSFGHTLIHTLLKQLSDDFKVETKGKFRLEFQFEERIRGAHSNYSG